MKKSYQLTDLDCANCAAQMEATIRQIAGVQAATVNFMTQKLTLEVEDSLLSSILSEAQKRISKIEPHCKITR